MVSFFDPLNNENILGESINIYKVRHKPFWSTVDSWATNTSGYEQLLGTNFSLGYKYNAYECMLLILL